MERAEGSSVWTGAISLLSECRQLIHQVSGLVGSFMERKDLYVDQIHNFVESKEQELRQARAIAEDLKTTSFSLANQAASVHYLALKSIEEGSKEEEETEAMLAEAMFLQQRSTRLMRQFAEARDYHFKLRDSVRLRNEKIKSLKKLEIDLVREVKEAMAKGDVDLASQLNRQEKETRAEANKMEKTDFSFLTFWFDSRFATSNRNLAGVQATHFVTHYAENGPKDTITQKVIHAFHSMHYASSQFDKIISAIHGGEIEIAQTLIEMTLHLSTTKAIIDTNKLLEEMLASTKNKSSKIVRDCEQIVSDVEKAVVQLGGLLGKVFVTVSVEPKVLYSEEMEFQFDT